MNWEVMSIIIQETILNAIKTSTSSVTKEAPSTAYPKMTNLEGLSIAFALSEVPDDALELSESKLVSLLNPIVEHWRHSCAAISERTDHGVQGWLSCPAPVVSSAASN